MVDVLRNVIRRHLVQGVPVTMATCWQMIGRHVWTLTSVIWLKPVVKPASISQVLIVVNVVKVTY